jgi:uncharacterized membrane protein
VLKARAAHCALLGEPPALRLGGCPRGLPGEDAVTEGTSQGVTQWTLTADDGWSDSQRSVSVCSRRRPATTATLITPKSAATYGAFSPAFAPS